MILQHAHFSSRFVSPRHVDVWLPPEYHHTTIRYPVIYMQDGQFLFDATFYNLDNQDNYLSWGLDQTMPRLIKAKQIQGAIVVGIWNTPWRFQEYIPQKPCEQMFSPEEMAKFKLNYTKFLSDKYLKFIVKELKPYIDTTYRTLPDREHTFIMGASLGGMVSLYALCEYPDVFGGAAGLSAHWWRFGDGVMIPYLKHTLPDPASHKLYLDYGKELQQDEYITYQLTAHAVVTDAGYVQGNNFLSKEFPEEGHNEIAWRKRVDLPLLFLLQQAMSP